MGVNVSHLENGIIVATENIPLIESVALGIWVKSGSRSETDSEHGIAHLLEHMAFKGTSKRTARQIAVDIENVGGEINAATSVETTSYYARVLKDDMPLAIDILLLNLSVNSTWCCKKSALRMIRRMILFSTGLLKRPIKSKRLGGPFWERLNL
jgi:predicted Zn-dependent peptidase